MFLIGKVRKPKLCFHAVSPIGPHKGSAYNLLDADPVETGF